MAAMVLWRRDFSPSAAMKCDVLLVGERGAPQGRRRARGKTLERADRAGRAGGLGGADIIVDALFGAGLDRPVEGLARAMIDAMNAQGAPVIAVDLPSGINGTSGAVMGAGGEGDAHRYVLSQKARPPAAARPHCIAARFPSPISAFRPPFLQLSRRGPSRTSRRCGGQVFRVPRSAGHKYDRGHAVIVSGPSWSTGAARLAARGALRAGAGLVTIASPREALAVNAAASLAVMVRPVDGAAELATFLADRRLNALAIGPGIGVQRGNLRARPRGALRRARRGARCGCHDELCAGAPAARRGAEGARRQGYHPHSA